MERIKKLIFIIVLFCLSIKTSYAVVKIVPSETFIGVDYSQNLRVFNTESGNISWVSSNPNVVFVNNGKIVGLKTGESYIKATDGETIALCKVKVIDNYVPVESIKLSQSEGTLLLNDIIRLTPNIYPINASNKNPSYMSSNPSVASVDLNGYVVAKKIGTTNISVYVENKVAIYKVNVVDKVLLQSISVQSSISLKPNGTAQLVVSYNPNNATDKSVTYKSSNTNIATVSSSGLVTAKAPGTATITVMSNDGSHVATSKVTVVNNTTNAVTIPSVTTNNQINNQTTTTKNSSGVKLKGILLNQTNLSLNINDEEILSVTYNPSNATDKGVIWKSSDTSIATVSDNGKVRAIAAGTTTISAISNDGHYEAKCTVNVVSGDIADSSNKKLKSIRLNENNISIKKGDEKTLEVIYTPNNATNKEVTWESTDESIVTVNNGKIKAISIGSARVKVVSVDGGYEDKCYVTVFSDSPVESITFKNEKETIYLGYNLTLDTVITPKDALLENPIWTSSNEEVATVKNGVVNALKVGNTTITVSDEKGEIYASIIINVIKKPPEKLEVSVEGYDLNFDANVKNYTLEIGGESSLIIKTNYDSDNVVIGGNRDLKNGSIITITADGYNTGKSTYVINIKKKGFNIIYFIAIVSIILIINLIRIMISSTRKKKK